MEYVKGFVTSPIFKSFARTFIAVILVSFIAGGADLFALGLNDLRIMLAAGLAAAGAVLVRALDVNDDAFGRVRKDESVEEG